MRCWGVNIFIPLMVCMQIKKKKKKTVRKYNGWAIKAGVIIRAGCGLGGFFTCLQAGCLWGCSAAHLSWLPGNSEVHLCSLTHILAHGLAYKITFMHIYSLLLNPWGRIPALPGAVSIPWVAPLVQSCLLMNNSARTELQSSAEINEMNF